MNVEFVPEINWSSLENIATKRIDVKRRYQMCTNSLSILITLTY